MPRKGYKQTDEHREKQRQAKSTLEWKDANSGLNNHLFGKKQKPEVIEKRRQSRILTISDPEWKKNHSGVNGNTYGNHRSEASKLKIRLARLGERNPNFIDGLSNNYPKEWTEALRQKIRERDHYTCQFCGFKHEIKGGLKNRTGSVHHINSDVDDFSESNLITLCAYCHVDTIPELNRPIYSATLQWIMNMRYTYVYNTSLMISQSTFDSQKENVSVEKRKRKTLAAIVVKNYRN